jgi:hypothetical protein
MDPDLVRQQEEAERAADAPAQKKPVHGTVAGSLEKNVEAPAEFAETPAIPSEVSGQPAAEAPISAGPAAAKKAVNPNRRALPPIGTGRRPGEAPPKRRRIRGLVRLLAYAVGGGIVGAALGYLSVLYYPLVPADQAQTFIEASAGGFALLFGLLHLLNFDNY